MGTLLPTTNQATHPVRQELPLVVVIMGNTMTFVILLSILVAPGYFGNFLKPITFIFYKKRSFF